MFGTWAVLQAQLDAASAQTLRVTERPLLEFIAASNKLVALSTQNRRPGRLRVEAFRGVTGLNRNRLLRQWQGRGIV